MNDLQEKILATLRTRCHRPDCKIKHRAKTEDTIKAIEQLLQSSREELIDQIEKEVKKLKPDTELLGCQKHWSDDYQAECTCDENESVAKNFYGKAIESVIQLLNKYKEK